MVRKHAQGFFLSEIFTHFQRQHEAPPIKTLNSFDILVNCLPGTSIALEAIAEVCAHHRIRSWGANEQQTDIYLKKTNERYQRSQGKLMNLPMHTKLIAALGLSLLAGSAHAIDTDYAFQIDSFFVFKNVDPAALDDPTTLAATAAPIFMDGFDNGYVPGDSLDTHTFSNGTTATYGVSTGSVVGPEGNSKLSLSYSGMVDNGYGTLRTNVNLNTNASSDGANAGLGLKQGNDNFAVVGVWDLTYIGNNMGSYGIRFNDSIGGVTGNDIISLGVQGREDGQTVVSMLHFDNVTGTSSVLSRQVLEAGHQQIALGLGYLDTDGNGTKEVGAGYFYLDDNGLTPSIFYDMNATTQIFHDESWTRAAFYAANSNITPVPEASQYAMMLAGLGLIGFVVRRRQV
ncbi:MAG: PEP-CTERM sorting domain-containing protein [Thiobacillus sp.]